MPVNCTSLVRCLATDVRRRETTLQLPRKAPDNRSVQPCATSNRRLLHATVMRNRPSPLHVLQQVLSFSAPPTNCFSQKWAKATATWREAGIRPHPYLGCLHLTRQVPQFFFRPSPPTKPPSTKPCTPGHTAHPNWRCPRFPPMHDETKPKLCWREESPSQSQAISTNGLFSKASPETRSKFSHTD